MNAQSKIEPALTGLDLLRAPFPDHQISKLPKETRKQADERKANRNVILWNCPVCGGMHHKDATHLDYVGHAALTDRLLKVDPLWTWEPVAFTPEGLPAFDRTGGLWIKLTVCGVTRLGYGCADGKQGGDAVKEIIGDALRNAGMRFGAALDLWHKGDLHLEPEEETPAPTKVAEAPAKKASGTITDEQLVKLQSLIQATNWDAISLLRALGAPEKARLANMRQATFETALEKLNERLADMAKADSNVKANTFGELIDDEIPY